MSPETRDFLSRVRKAEGPAPGAEGRVLAALEARIATGVTSTALGAAPATKGVVSATGVGLKVVGGLLGVSACAALVAAAISSRTAEPTDAAHTSRVPISVAPLRASAPAAASAAPPTSAAVAPPPVDLPSSPHPTKQAGPQAAAASAASLREELALLGDVQAALERGDGAQALRRLDGHTTSDRQFVAERRAARITALCLLGRVAEAQALGAVFFREHPQSVQRTAVERSCAATKTENP